MGPTECIQIQQQQRLIIVIIWKFYCVLNKLFGEYIGITVWVRPSIVLVSATPPKQMKGY